MMGMTLRPNPVTIIKSHGFCPMLRYCVPIHVYWPCAASHGSYTESEGGYTPNTALLQLWIWRTCHGYIRIEDGTPAYGHRSWWHQSYSSIRVCRGGIGCGSKAGDCDETTESEQSFEWKVTDITNHSRNDKVYSMERSICSMVILTCFRLIHDRGYYLMCYEPGRSLAAVTSCLSSSRRRLNMRDYYVGRNKLYSHERQDFLASRRQNS